MRHPLLFAIAVCIVSVMGEALFMGKDGRRWMETLRQPPFAPPFAVWTLIGFAYYGICFLALYRMAHLGLIGSLPMALLLILMSANTFWNYVYFRRRDLRLAFWYSIAYVPRAIALVATLWRIDWFATAGFIVYLAYLPYALWLFRATFRLNPASS